VKARREPRTVELHVEELVLHGFAPGDRDAVAAAVERELTRLLARDGPPAAWGQDLAVERLDAGSFRHAPEGGPRRAGAEVARAVWKGVRA